MSQTMSRVLMLDDAGLFRMLETSSLRRPGCAIVRAGDGAELLRKAGTCSPQLIVLEAQRPGPEGAMRIREIKSDPRLRDVPVLVVAEASGASDCRQAGADAVLTLPLRPGDFDLALASVGQMTQRNGPRRLATGRVRLDGPEWSARGRLKDISRSGLFVTLKEPLPPQSSVDLSLRLGGSSSGARPLRARGVIVRLVRPDRDSHLLPGAGVRFTDLEAIDLRRLERFMDAPPPRADGRRGDASPPAPES